MKMQLRWRTALSLALTSVLFGGIELIPTARAQEFAATSGRGGSATAAPATAPATAAARGGRGRGTPRQPPLEWSGARMYPLDVTIYEVRVPADQVGRIDVEKLEKAAAVVADFEKGLAEVGVSKPLYRVTQAVRLDQDYVQVGSNEPYISNSQVTTRGQTVNSVAYTNTGAIIELIGRESGGNMEVDMRIQLSRLGDAGVPVSETVKAPNIRSATLLRKAPVKPKQPFVIMSVDAASPDANGKAVAYVARVVLGAAESSITPK